MKNPLKEIGENQSKREETLKKVGSGKKVDLAQRTGVPKREMITIQLKCTDAPLEDNSPNNTWRTGRTPTTPFPGNGWTTVTIRRAPSAADELTDAEAAELYRLQQAADLIAAIKSRKDKDGKTKTTTTIKPRVAKLKAD